MAACSHCQTGEGTRPHPVAGRGKVCVDCAADFEEFAPAVLAARQADQDARFDKRERDKERSK